MATKLIQESTLTNIADAIRAKTGKVDTMTPAEMPSEIGSISGGTDTRFKDLVSRSITSVNDSEITVVGATAFASCTALTSVDMSNATSIGQQAFASCTALTSVDMSNATSIGQQAFDFCSALTSVSLPNVIYGDSQAFRNCTNLESINLPKLTAVMSNFFQSCSKLKIADLAVATSLGGNAFSGDNALMALILRKTDGIVTLANASNVLNSSGIVTGNGKVYVPSALIDTYKQATSWRHLYTNYGDFFEPIEGSPFENTNYDVTTVLAQLALAS